MTPLLVLHRLGDEGGATAWRTALEAGGWNGEWDASDLPGHDYFDPADLVMAALHTSRGIEWAEPPLVVAVGSQFVVAQLLALAGRASGIVLVDVPPILDVDPDESQRLQYDWLRRVADDPGRPRGLPPFTDAPFWASQRAAIRVPALELPDNAPGDVLATVRDWWGDVTAAQR